MADLSVNFMHPQDGKVISVTVDNTMTAQEAIAELIANNFMSANPDGYNLAIKGGAQLNNNKTLAEGGVKDNDTLRVLPATDAGSNLTPQENRNVRLSNDYKEMVNIRGTIIQWQAIKGTEPYVEEYEVTINIRSVISETPSYSDKHVVRVSLPANYPIVPPDIVMISSPLVFHPNWYRNGKWCYGSWSMSEMLGHHVIRMIKTLQYDPDITNEHSPANVEAKDWYVSNRRKGIFPCDKQVLPDPTKKRMTFNVQPKKKFEIK